MKRDELQDDDVMPSPRESFLINEHVNVNMSPSSNPSGGNDAEPHAEQFDASTKGLLQQQQPAPKRFSAHDMEVHSIPNFTTTGAHHKSPATKSDAKSPITGFLNRIRSSTGGGTPHRTRQSWFGGTGSVYRDGSEINYAPSEAEGRFKQKRSILVADTFIKSSPEYKKLMKVHHPISVVTYWIFLTLGPLVFRYMMAAVPAENTSVTKSSEIMSNTSVAIRVPWQKSEQCTNLQGVTLSNFTVRIQNQYLDPTSSIAIFASKDFQTWFNFYSPSSINSPSYLSNFTSELLINQTNGEACLGTNTLSYLVACLNDGELSSTLQKGEIIAPPPFNDRCREIAGVCGIPGTTVTSDPYTSYCPNGIIDEMFLSNSTGITSSTTTEVLWFNGLSPVDWIVIITILLDAFANLLRFLPVLSGAPTELLNNNREVVVTGRAVLCCASPFATEKEGIFLRSLIGRTATALHSVGSRHQMRALYIDTIVNEDAANLARYEQWRAWMEFLDLLCTFKTEDMEWKDSWRKASPNAPRRIVTVGQGICKTYVCDPTAIDFEGYKDYTLDGPSDTDYSRHLSQECKYSQDQSKAKKINLIDILPALCFLDGWVEQIKVSEAGFPNYNKNDTYMLALQSVFNAAPCQKFFSGANFLKIHSALEKLFEAFSKQKALRAPRSAIYRDFRKEFVWRISKGDDLPTIDIAWVYFSRSKIDGSQGRLLTNCTKIVPESIVYIKPVITNPKLNPLNIWLKAREKTYQVINIDYSQSSTNPLCTVVPWPPESSDSKASDAENGKLNSTSVTQTVHVEFSKLDLIQRNRGKAGALNTILEYTRLRTKYWCYVTGHDDVNDPVQLLFGIIDARHMIVEPTVFWNDSLPYFSINAQTGKNTKKLGEAGASVILVQFPQYFSNVGKDDYLDNKNSAYYVIWQTLRDCAKTVTSSGTNAIWDATDESFCVQTCCRVEDTATTQHYLDKHYTIHLPFFVAHGIAKDTQDYIEAVYRWSTGGVELFWSSLFDKNKVFHYLLIGQIFIMYCAASVVQSVFAYYLWLLFVVALAFSGYCEMVFNRRPFRLLNVSATVVMNTTSWVSCLFSFVWLILVPISIAFYRKAPIASTAGQAVAWSFVALLIRVPQAIICDQIIAMARFLAPKSEIYANTDYNMLLWRASQLYSCSFMYTLLSFIFGTYAAYRAYFYHQDNTFWDSFKYPAGQWHLVFLDCISSPEFTTKVLSIFLLFLQITCIVGAIAISFSNSYLTLITILVCVFNILLVVDIFLLLFPIFRNLSVMRPEYGFALFALVVIVGSIFQGYVNGSILQYTVAGPGY